MNGFASRGVRDHKLRIIDRLEYVHNCGILYRDIKFFGRIPAWPCHGRPPTKSAQAAQLFDGFGRSSLSGRRVIRVLSVSEDFLLSMYSPEAHSSRVYIVDFGLAKSHVAAVSTLAHVV